MENDITSDDDVEPEIEISEIAKHTEADNIMSYHEQVEQECRDYEVHQAFYSGDDELKSEVEIVNVEDAYDEHKYAESIDDDF